MPKQVEATGQAVARMTLDMMSDSDADEHSVHSAMGVPHRSSRPPPVAEPSHRRAHAGGPRPNRDVLFPDQLCPSYNFLCSLVKTPKSGVISVLTIFISPTLKSLCGSRLFPCTLIRRLQSGCRYTRRLNHMLHGLSLLMLWNSNSVSMNIVKPWMICWN